jgi:hypothetical protein
VKAALPFAALVAEPAVAQAAVTLWVRASAATAATAKAGTDSVANAEQQCAAVQLLAQGVVLALLQQCGIDMRRLVVQCLASAVTADNTEQCTDSSSDSSAVLQQQRNTVLLYGLALPLSSTSGSSGGADVASNSNQLLRELLLRCSEDPCAATRGNARAIVCSVCTAVTTSITSTQQQRQQQQQQQQYDAAALLSCMRPFEPLLQAAAWRWCTVARDDADSACCTSDDIR